MIVKTWCLAFLCFIRIWQIAHLTQVPDRLKLPVVMLIGGGVGISIPLAGLPAVGAAALVVLVGSLPVVVVWVGSPPVMVVLVGALHVVLVGALPPVLVGALPPVLVGALPPVLVGALPPVLVGALPPVLVGALPPVVGGVFVGGAVVA